MIFDDLVTATNMVDVGNEMPVKVSTYVLGAEPVKRREEMRRIDEESKDIYNNQTEEERRATIASVVRTMNLLIDNVDVWLPSSLRMDTVGETLTVEINLVALEIDKQAKYTNKLTSRDMTELKEMAEQMYKELSDTPVDK